MKTSARRIDGHLSFFIIINLPIAIDSIIYSIRYLVIMTTKVCIYDSDPTENGYKWSSAINDYIYIESEEMEHVDDLTKEKIEPLIEEGVAFLWDNEWEWDIFQDNFKKAFDVCPAFVLHGRVKAWDGVHGGGKVYYGEKATFDRLFTDLWKDADDMEITIEDGDMVISTRDHDGGMTFTLRSLTYDDVDYYLENPDDLSDSEMGAKLLERGIKADKFLEGQY